MEDGFFDSEDEVIAQMPVFSSGDVMIDLFVGEESNCAFRPLTKEEIGKCLLNGRFYFSDGGIDLEAQPPAQIISLNKMGKLFGEELYRRKYWPKPLFCFYRFCEAVSSLVA